METFCNPQAAPLANACGWMSAVAEDYDEPSSIMWPLYFCESLVSGLEYIIFTEYFTAAPVKSKRR